MTNANTNISNEIAEAAALVASGEANVAAQAAKRTVSKAGEEALAKHRARAELAMNILAVIERDHAGMLEDLTAKAGVFAEEQKAKKAAEEAERKANALPRGAALEQHRKMLATQKAMIELLATKGLDMVALQAEAEAKLAQQAK